MKIAYYITGHGYGHAVRSIEVIKQLLCRQPDLQVSIRTSAPQWLFAELPPRRVSYHPVNLDIGAVQSDSFAVDRQATLTANHALLPHLDELQQKELVFLEDQSIDAVISDITALAFAAARHLPTFAVGNFSWDWIYSAWQADYPKLTPIIERLRADYEQADLLFRLPFYGDLSVFPRIQDTGLVCRQSTLSREEVRCRLGIQPDQKILFIALRAQDLQRVHWSRLQLDSWTLLGTPFIPHPRALAVREGFLPFVDILQACDAVISKPGYGIVSDVLANQTPMIYVPREDFVEDPILCTALDRLAISERLTRENFWAGRWQNALSGLQQSPGHWAPIDLQGAEQIAKTVLRKLSTQAYASESGDDRP